MSQQKIYDMVTERILKMLEQGVVPWRKPWVANGANSAVNWKTQKPYRGVNTMILPAGEYATWKQITEAGGNVKKGEKSHIVVFWRFLEIKDEESGEKKKVPFLRYYSVFEINTQCEGLTSKRKPQETFGHDPIEEAEKIVQSYTDGPKTSYKSGQAFYRPSTDSITVPPSTDYPKIEEYYCTLFHEQIHSTGHKDRLNRPGIEQVAAFGSETYSKEELVAEIGAAMLCATAGIDNSTIENSAAYINSWLRVLKQETKWVVQAAGLAQRGVDLILGVKYEEDGGEE